MPFMEKSSLKSELKKRIDKKISKEELVSMKYDALKIAEKELNENVLPISISRPTPRRGKDKLSAVKEEKLSDEELIEKAKELEKEITQDAKEIGFVNEGDADEETTEMEPVEEA